MKKHALKSLHILTQICLVIVIGVLVLAGTLIYKLSEGPIELGFAKDYVVQSLNDGRAGSNVRIDVNTVNLEWAAQQNQVFLTLNDLKIFQKAPVVLGQEKTEEEALEIDKALIGVSARHLLIGQLRPSVVVIEAPILKFTRRDGAYDFFWDEMPAVQKTTQASDDIMDSIMDDAFSVNGMFDDVFDEMAFGFFFDEIEPENAATVISDNAQLRKKVADILKEIANPQEGIFAQFSEMNTIIFRRALLEHVSVDGGTFFQEGNKERHYAAMFDLTLRRVDMGLEGNIVIDLPSDQGEKAQLKSAITYRKEQQDLTFDGKITSFNPLHMAYLWPDEEMLTAQSFILNGDIKAAFNKDMMLENAAMVLSVPEGEIKVPDSYDAPLNVQNAVLDIALQKTQNKLALNNLKARVNGIEVIASGSGDITGGDLVMPLSLKIPSFTFEKLQSLLPKSIKGTTIEKWLVQRLKDGVVEGLEVKGDLSVLNDAAGNNRDIDLKNMSADFGFKGLTVAYSETLKPVTNAVGTGKYSQKDDTLIITGQSADIGDVKGRDVKVTMSGLSVTGGGKANITLKGKGPLKTIFDYIADKPIALNESEIGIKASDTAGLIDFDLALSFPTVKDLPKEEVTVVINSTITDARLPKIVRGMDLTGGPYALSFEKGKIDLKGKGKLAAYPIDLHYQQYLAPKGKPFETKVLASLTADGALRDKFGIGLSDYLKGSVPIEVDYTEKASKDAVIKVKGKLDTAQIFIKEFDYYKPSGSAGDIALNAYIKNDVITEIDNLSLSAAGLSAQGGRLLFTPINGEPEVTRGQFASLELGRTKTPLEFEVASGDILKIKASGGVIDMAPFIDSDTKKATEARTLNVVWDNPADADSYNQIWVSLDASRGFTAKEQYISGLKLFAKLDQDSDITHLEIDGKVGLNERDRGDLYVRFVPESNGQRVFRMESSNAGGALKAFGLYDDIIGGEIKIYGNPQKGDLDGNLFGRAQINNFIAQDTPVLARLLGAMSQSGMQDALKARGVSFERLEADFEWRFRDQGNLLVMKKGRTKGSSLGLTFEGVADIGASTLDLSGTVIPLSGVNKAIGDIPILGSLLTGGSKGGLIAATYNVGGPSNNPKVSINPLSVLAPGFLRKILFEEDVKDKIKANESGKNGSEAVNDNGNNNGKPVTVAPQMKNVNTAPKEQTVNE